MGTFREEVAMTAKNSFRSLFTVTVAVSFFLFALSVLSFGWLWPSIGLGIELASLVYWIIVSWSNIVSPDQVALRQWFGRLEKKIIKSGLCFVPWFPGIKLVRIPKKMFRLLYEKEDDKPGHVMSGTMFGVRSSDRQKLFVEATFFLRFPYNHVEPLIKIIESGVPFGDEDELREWIEDAIAPDVLYVFGQEKYEDVMGGTKNIELNKLVNDRLRGDPAKPNDSLLERCGLFGANPNDQTTPGEGEAYLNIEDVHLSGELGKRLELVETARLEAEAERDAAIVKAVTAQSVAEKDAEETHGRVLKMVAKTCGLTVELLQQKLNDDRTLKATPEIYGGFKEAFDQAYDQVKRDRAGDRGELTDIRIGNTDGTPFQEGAIIGGLAAIFQQSRGGKNVSSSSGGSTKKNPGDAAKETEEWLKQRKKQ